MPDVAVLVEAVVASSEEHAPGALSVPDVPRVPVEGAIVLAVE